MIYRTNMCMGTLANDSATHMPHINPWIPRKSVFLRPTNKSLCISHRHSSAILLSQFYYSLLIRCKFLTSIMNQNADFANIIGVKILYFKVVHRYWRLKNFMLRLFDDGVFSAL